MVRLTGGTLLSNVTLCFQILLLSRRGLWALLDAFVFNRTLQAGRVVLRALVHGRPPPGPPAPLPVQRADWRVGAGRHEGAVGVQLVQGGAVDEDVVAVGHALAASEQHGVGGVRHGVLHSHQAFLVSVLQLLLVQDGVHLHSDKTDPKYVINAQQDAPALSCSIVTKIQVYEI